MASDEGRAFVLLDVLLDDFDAAGERRCRGVDAGDGQRHALQCEDFALTLRIDLNERVFERVSHARGTEGWFFGVLSSHVGGEVLERFLWIALHLFAVLAVVIDINRTKTLRSPIQPPTLVEPRPIKLPTNVGAFTHRLASGSEIGIDKLDSRCVVQSFRDIAPLGDIDAILRDHDRWIVVSVLDVQQNLF